MSLKSDEDIDKELGEVKKNRVAFYILCHAAVALLSLQMIASLRNFIVIISLPLEFDKKNIYQQNTC